MKIISSANPEDIKPLDIVITPRGAYAYVTEVHSSSGSNEVQVSISYFGMKSIFHEKNSWWNASQLTIIDNIASIIAREMVHPFGSGKQFALDFYPVPDLSYCKEDD